MQQRPRARETRLARRDRLVTEHIDIVRPIARMIAARVPSTFELEDLISIGTLALVQAADRYAPRKHGNTPFSAYARMVVRGSMLDAVSGRHFTRAKNTTSLDGDGGLEQLKFSPDYAAGIDQARVRKKILAATGELPERQRAVLVAYYGEGRTLADISAEYGVHSATASGWHMDAIRGLRKRLGVRQS